MRWTVEADTARDVVTWPEEFDDFLTALRADLSANRAACHVDVPSGSVHARFQVDAVTKDEAEEAARRVMATALARAGLSKVDEPLAFIAATHAPPA